jgi:acyl-coenzyme A thioesterase PaaI-like protein
MFPSDTQYPNAAKLSLLQASAIHVYNNLILTRIENATSTTPTAYATVTTLPRHLTPRKPPSLHGGITTSVLDSICLFAVTPTLQPGEESVTIASSFQLIGAVVGVGKVVELEGRVLRRGKRVVFCESVAMCEGVLVARGMLTKSIVPPPRMKDEEEKGGVERESKL